MIKKILIPLLIEEVAPRFDLATEVRIISPAHEHQIPEERTVVLPQASSEKLCHMILTEHINAVICGAIEEEYYQFLKWKKIEVIDSVAGPADMAIAQYLNHSLKPGAVLWPRQIEGRNV